MRTLPAPAAISATAEPVRGPAALLPQLSELRLPAWLPLPWALFAVAAALRVASFLVIYLLAVASGRPGHFDMLDPVYFDHWAWYVAEHLRQGHLVDIRPYNLAGTYDIGFEYFVGLQYAVVGHHSEVPRLVNALLSAACAPLIYLAGRRTPLGDSGAAVAGWLMALWPLSVYWAGYDLIKDPIAWFLLSVAIFAITSPRRLTFVALGATAVIGLLLVRSYVGIGMFAFVPAVALVRRDWRGFLALVGVLAVAEGALIAVGQPPVYSFLPFTGNGLPFASQNHRIAQGSLASIAGGAVGDTSGGGIAKAEGGTDAVAVLHQSPGLILERAVVGTAITVAGPRPAVKDILHPTMDTAMYPGLLVWLLLIPFTVLGIVRAVARRNGIEIALAVLSVGLLLGLSFFYGGVFRQREMVWPSTLLLTAEGLRAPYPRNWRRLYGGFLAIGALVLVAREAYSLLHG